MRRVYLDYAATTPTDPEVVQAMLPYFTDIFGNPSSVHLFGHEAREAVEAAREAVAALIGANPGEIVFTSGGTESDNLSIKGVAFANRDKGNHLITSAIEHHAVLEPCSFLEKNGFRVTILPVDKDGLVDPDEVKKAITDETILISIMHANNEIGTMEPLEEIGKIAKERDIYFHTDAVQTFGHVPIDVNHLGVDLLSASAHKLYGPKGVGMCYVRTGTKIIPFMHGGMQEKGRRASTHNVPGIVGLGKAVELAAAHMDNELQGITSLRNRLIDKVESEIGHVKLNGHPVLRLPNNANISFKNADGEFLMSALNIEGIACSTGSACSSSGSGPSHVLHALGLSYRMIEGSLRFSLGRRTTEDDIEYVVGVLARIVKKAREMSPFPD